MLSLPRLTASWIPAILHSVLVRAKNERTLINRLPRELLSNIFVIGCVEIPGSGEWNRPFPIRLSQVCSHWRRLAIGNSLLWDCIHISGPPPNSLATLYLSRVGPNVPLDIVLELRGAYWRKAGINPRHWSAHADHLPALLEFLASNGARIHRWRSLIINVRTPRVAFEIIRVLDAETAPALRFFSCTWHLGAAEAYTEEEDDCVNDLIHQYGTFESFKLSGPSFPNMRSAELSKIPWSFVLERPTNVPLLSGLVSLKLGAAFGINGLEYFPHLFSANPQLEELCLDAGLGWEGGFLESYPRASLPFLQRLEISTGGAWGWICRTLGMIDAPNVERLVLSLHDELGMKINFAEIFTCVATGITPATPSESGAEPVAIQPMFPSLQCLHIYSAPVRKSHEVKALKLLLSAFPLVHDLNISGGSAGILGKEPWLLPNLTRLGMIYETPPQLGGILRRRLAAGLPMIHEVDIYNFWEIPEIEGSVPDSTTLTSNRPRPEFEVEFYGSDLEDEDEWDDM